MSDRKLIVSFGSGVPRPKNAQFAIITHVQHLTWSEVVEMFKAQPPLSEDKSSAGWYAFGEFDPVYRDSDNLIARHALTFDFDHISREDVKTIQQAYADLEYVMYTTASHTAEKPRLRMVLPLSRPAGYDEFQAVSRKLAARAGIELASRETHVPAQMMYMPTVKPGQQFSSKHRQGSWVDVDAVLAEYEDWTDRAQWPKRKEGDGVHAEGLQILPTEKVGIVGDFCRAIDVYQAIERFHLPYEPTASEGRLTYTAGSRPEGAVVYDHGTKLHSHHDTDPARGQTNAFDLVRLHKFGNLDSAEDLAKPVTERPSFQAMARLALEQPEIRSEIADAEFEDLGELTPEESMPKDASKGAVALAKRICDVLKTPTRPRWLITDYIERAVIALLVGMRGSYKSFIALDWSMRVAMALDPDSNEAVYVVSGEGGDFDRRALAWISRYAPDRTRHSIPLYVVERRLDLSTKDGVELIRQDCLRLGIQPVLFVLDTLSKLSGGLDENDNTAVKAFIGRLDNGLKRAETGFDATVLLVAHTGHSDASRARGASALGADTDAEYIVARDGRSGAVSVSRERFKASPELPPIRYAPEVVDLGYAGDDGKPVTSLVLRETTEKDVQHAREPTGTKSKQLWRILLDLAPDGAPVPVKDVLDAAVEAEAAPADGERDRRREKATVRLNNLQAAGFVYFSEAGAKVALSRTKVIPEAEFVDDPLYT